MPVAQGGAVSGPDLADVRVLAIWSDDPTESPLTFDLRIDLDARRTVGAWSTFGAASLGAKAQRPFVLSSGGDMDFGEGRPTDQRIWRTDLRQREIAAGKEFLVIFPGGDTAVYVIEKVAILGRKSGQS